MTEEREAKEAALLMMMAGFPYWAGKADRVTIDAFLVPLEPYSAEAVALACRRFASGDVPDREPSRSPSASEVAQQAKVFQDGIDYRRKVRAERDRIIVYPVGELPPPPAVPLGPISVDFGHGKIDMRGMSPEEKEAVMARGGRPAPAADSIEFKPRLKGMN